MWKKLLTPTLIITLVLLFGLTWYCSIKTEEYFQLWVERSNQLAPALMTTELVDYQRQFFTAQATTSQSFSGAETVELNHLIRHYVWGVSMITTAAPTTDEQTAPLADLRIVTNVDPAGNARARLTLPQLSVATTDTLLTIERIAGEWHMNADATAGSWNVVFDQGKLQLDEETALSIANGKLSGEATDLHLFPLGSQQTTIDAMTLHAGDRALFSLTGISILSKTQRQASGLYDAGSDISVTNLEGEGEAFHQGRLNVVMTDISNEMIDAFLFLRKELRLSLRNNEFHVGDLEQRFVEPLLDEVLKSGLTLSLKELALATDGGSLAGSGQIFLLPGHKQPLSFDLLEQIDARLDLTFDARILNHLARFSGQQQTNRNAAVQEEELRMLLYGLAQLEFLTQQDVDRFRLLFSFEKGELKLNDQPLRLL